MKQFMNAEHHQIECYTTDSDCYKNCEMVELQESTVFREGGLGELGVQGYVNCGLQENREMWFGKEQRA